MLKKVLALSVLAAMSLSVLTACGNRPQRPADAADISDEEISIIRVMQSEGKDEMEIAEALVLHEKTASGQKAAPAVKAAIYSGFGSAVADTASDMLEYGRYLFRKITAAPVSASSDGWVKDGGDYYFYKDGKMITGWVKDGSWYYLSASGAMVTDWQKIDGKNYYFYASGRMAFNTTIDGVKLGVSGAAETTPSYVFRNDVEEECVRLINGLRKEHAVSLSSTFYVPLVRCDALTAKAHIRCVEITKDFSHDSAGGNGLGSECIYEGGELGETASEIAYWIVNSWKGSAPHYASLMTGITAQSVNDIFYSGANCGLGVLINAKGHRYAVFGIGSMNTGRSPSTGFDGHCYHYTEYVTSYRSGNDWFDTYRCSCGKELSAKAASDPCTCHFNGKHKWSRPGFYSSYRYDSENKPCVVCVRCGATGPRWEDIQQTPLDVNCDHDWEFEITEDVPGGYLDWFHCSKCGAWDLRFDTV